MNNNITVIVTKCDSKEQAYGNWLVNENVSSLDVAMAIGEPLRAIGVCVLIRPNYNEVDAEGRHFREWRSFNGEAFREVRFAY